MERLDLFASPALKARTPGAVAANASLLAAIRELRAWEEGVSRSSPGGWHSDFGMTAWAGEPVRSQHLIRPEAGLLVLFSSWLRQSLRRLRGDRERPSVAMNLLLTGVPLDGR